MLVTHYHWSEEDRQLSVYCRETGSTIYQCCFANFREAKKVADAFDQLYAQGVRHGTLKATEEMRRTVDHIDRNI